MNKLKLLCVTIGLFLQGCATELPLFKNEDTIKSDEAVVVFSFYTTDKNYGSRGLLNFTPEKIYMNLKLAGQSIHDFSKRNYMSADGVEQRYIVAKLPAGAYYIETYDTTYVYSTNGLQDSTITMSSNKLESTRSPLMFTVAPGDVIYLGDIEIVKTQQKESGYNTDSYIPRFVYSNQIADAKKFMNQRYPSLSVRLKAGGVIKLLESQK